MLAYLLDGLAGVERIAGATRAAKRRTERHRERYGDPDDTVAEPAAYDLSDYLDATRGDRDALEARLRRSGTCADLLDDGSYAGALDPDRLVVAVSASTMSSGFAGAAQLTAFGADVVGVPSGQAPVSFGEPVGIELPNTGLAGRVGCALYHWVPEPDGRTLTPDAELTPERFEGYDRAADAGLRLAFDHAGVTDGEPPRPVADGG
ncbi:hypothetical protein [Halosegnis marinus]|uniref:hypothetical protein n=1 Tax=Halosegnis marinus TaxID=3034023 RepID=UPI0036166A81